VQNHVCGAWNVRFSRGPRGIAHKSYTQRRVPLTPILRRS
jgi:hypothetical protein